jgi:hypothetical protein
VRFTVIRIGLIALLAAGVALPAAADSFDQELFDKFVELRVGSGDPVYWYSKGEVYSYPDGKLVALIEGFDTARLVTSESTKDCASQISRKIFTYNDPKTGEVLKEYNGKPVGHIKYPYQHITYKLAGDGTMATTVEQGAGQRRQTIVPDQEMIARRVGNTIYFSAPLFMSFKTPRGVYEAYENYDFVLNPAAKEPADRYQVIWNRFGDLPPWAGPGKSIIQMVCWRVASLADMPDTIRNYVENEAPLWKQPPRDMDEIRELQK